MAVTLCLTKIHLLWLVLVWFISSTCPLCPVLTIINSPVSQPACISLLMRHVSQLKRGLGLTGSGCQNGRDKYEEPERTAQPAAVKIVNPNLKVLSLLPEFELLFSSPEPTADCGGAYSGWGWMLQAIDLNYTVCRLQTPGSSGGRKG